MCPCVITWSLSAVIMSACDGLVRSSVRPSTCLVMLVIPGLRFFVNVTSSSIDATTSATCEREGEGEEERRGVAVETVNCVEEEKG